MRRICRAEWYLQDADFCGQPRQASPPVIAVTALEDLGCGYHFDRPRVERATLEPGGGCVTRRGKANKIVAKQISYLLIGSGGRDRTYDQLINSQLLYR